MLDRNPGLSLSDMKKALLNVCMTIAGGAAFLSCQAYEWTKIIHEGARLSSNPWGAPQFGQSFFCGPGAGFHDRCSFLPVGEVATARRRAMAIGG